MKYLMFVFVNLLIVMVMLFAGNASAIEPISQKTVDIDRFNRFTVGTVCISGYVHSFAFYKGSQKLFSNYL